MQNLHYVAKNKKISPKESSNVKEFRPKIKIYLPVSRCDGAMVTAIIQKFTPEKISLIISVPILVNVDREDFKRNQLQSGSKDFRTLVKFWAKSREFTVQASIIIVKRPTQKTCLFFTF